jgi:hypothetical protein
MAHTGHHVRTQAHERRRHTAPKATWPTRLFVFAWNDQKQMGGFNDLLGIVPYLDSAMDLIHDHTQNWGQATASVVEMSTFGLTEIIVGTKRDDEWRFVGTENRITARE